MAAIIGGGVATSTYYTRILTPLAALLAGAFAASLVGWGGWTWAVPGAMFLGGSAAVSKIRASKKDTHSAAFESAGPRDAWQVLANGGIAWIGLGLDALGVPAPGAVWYAMGMGAFATAAADTWATELGTLSDRPPRSLRTGRPVPPGTSGAVSLPGTLGAVVGAATVAGGAWIGGGPGLPSDVHWSIGIIACGMSGMLVDSIAGATVQARYRHPTTGTLIEHPPTPDAQPVRGWRGVHNHVVNLIGTSAGAALAVGWILVTT